MLRLLCLLLPANSGKSSSSRAFSSATARKSLACEATLLSFTAFISCSRTHSNYVTILYLPYAEKKWKEGCGLNLRMFKSFSYLVSDFV